MAKDNNTKPSSTEAARKLLKEMGVTPEQVQRDRKMEVLTPKLALIGLFETVERFCGTAKSILIAGAGPMNTRSIMLLVDAIAGSLEVADKLVIEYTKAHLLLDAKEGVGTGELSNQELDEISDFLDKAEKNTLSTKPNLADLNKYAAENDNDDEEDDDDDDLLGAFNGNKKSGKPIIN